MAREEGTRIEEEENYKSKKKGIEREEDEKEQEERKERGKEEEGKRNKGKERNEGNV